MTLAELAKLHDVHANEIVDWKNQLLDRTPAVLRQSNVGACNKRPTMSFDNTTSVSCQDDFLFHSRGYIGDVKPCEWSAGATV